MPPKYKLTYFPITARAGMTRLMFAAAGVQYEDERIMWEDWPKLKPEMPQGQMPILQIDGKVTLAQSLTIARYIARELNFYGKNNLEAAYIDLILDTVEDLVTAAIPYLIEKDKTKKAEARTKFQEEVAPKFLGFVEKTIEQCGKDGFAVSSSLSVADFNTYNYIEFFGIEYLLDKFPKVAESCKQVKADKNIAKYLQERPANIFHPDIGP